MTAFQDDLEALQELLDFRFADRRLLEEALTHRSLLNERRGTSGDNQRLEFLGDAVLGLIVAGQLYRRLPQAREGALTRLRAAAVNEDTLAAAARTLDLGAWLRLGRGESRSGGRDRASLLADAFEALVAAIYLDAGFEAAERFVVTHLALDQDVEDYKTVLQEEAQRRGWDLPAYTVFEASGPAHEQKFAITVAVGGLVAHGEGTSRKKGEQAAARAALELLREP